MRPPFQKPTNATDIKRAHARERQGIHLTVPFHYNISLCRFSSLFGKSEKKVFFFLISPKKTRFSSGYLLQNGQRCDKI
jgi:hypothetical protein